MGFFDNVFGPKNTATATATIDSVTADIDAVQQQIDELRSAVETLKNNTVQPTEVVIQAGGSKKSRKSRKTRKHRR